MDVASAILIEVKPICSIIMNYIYVKPKPIHDDGERDKTRHDES